MVIQNNSNNLKDNYQERKFKVIIKLFFLSCFPINLIALLFLILNNNKVYSMQTHSTVFNYPIDKQQQPTIPSILRYQQRMQKLEKAIIYPEGQINFQPQELIVDVHKMNLTHRTDNSVKNDSTGIRRDIDFCLDAVCSVYQEQKSKRRSEQGETSHNSINMPVIAENAIHRIDHNLILEYINTIYRQYGFPNYFGTIDQRIIQKYPIQKQDAPLLSKSRKQESKHKKYLNMTLNAKKQQTIETKLPRPSFDHLHQRSPYQNLMNTQQKQRQNNSQRMSIYKVPQDFRYCICCEAAILSINIDFHQNYECKGLKQIYQLDFKSLDGLLLNKIENIKHQIKVKIAEIQQLNLEKKSSGNKIYEQVFENMNDYITQLRFNEKSEIQESHQNYLKFRSAIDNIYSQCVELTNKLNWFVKVYTKLKEIESETKKGNFNTASALQQIQFKLQESVVKRGFPYTQIHTVQTQKNGYHEMISSFAEE